MVEGKKLDIFIWYICINALTYSRYEDLGPYLISKARQFSHLWVNMLNALRLSEATSENLSSKERDANRRQ